MPECVVPVHGGTCGVEVHRVPAGDLDWAWADDTGSTFGPRYPFDPYAALERFRQDMPRYGHLYSRLKAELDLGGVNLHQHRAAPHPEPRPDMPADHCGWPPHLAPIGWRCRVCGQLLEGAHDDSRGDS